MAISIISSRNSKTEFDFDYLQLIFEMGSGSLRVLAATLLYMSTVQDDRTGDTVLNTSEKFL